MCLHKSQYYNNKIQQLPTYRHLYERYLSELKDGPRTQTGKREDVIDGVVVEFRDAWIFMNVPPQTRQGAKKKFGQLFTTFDKL